MRKNEIGSLNLNVILQEALNPTGPAINYGGTAFRLVDKDKKNKNNYEKGIFNGETGKIIDVNLDMKSFVVDYDGNIIEYETGGQKYKNHYLYGDPPFDFGKYKFWMDEAGLIIPESAR